MDRTSSVGLRFIDIRACPNLLERGLAITLLNETRKRTLPRLRQNWERGCAEHGKPDNGKNGAFQRLSPN
jgi:hypothetical protein